MTLTYTRQELIKTTDCCNCGVQFGMTKSLYDLRLNDHGSFYCPNGHGQHFTDKTEAEKLREQLERVRKWNRDSEERLFKQRQLAERRAAAYKGQTTKLKKRAQAGACPCCNRSFVQLSRHIKTQHPEFTPEDQV